MKRRAEAATVGGIIRDRRKAIGLSQKQFASLLGLAQNTVSHWETGFRYPGKKHLRQIADYLGLAVEDLLVSKFEEQCEDTCREQRPRVESALDAVRTERKRQDLKWGPVNNNHPFEWMSILGEEYGELSRAVNETYFTSTHVKPDFGGPHAIYLEACHVAATAVAIMESVASDLEA